MSLFFISVAILIVGYFTYGVLIDRLFKPDPARTTPAYAQTDGVDYVPMSWPNIFLIELLNIAGLGPIFGALAGALWGPVAFLWIVFGCLFAGGVPWKGSGVSKLNCAQAVLGGPEVGCGFAVRHCAASLLAKAQPLAGAGLEPSHSGALFLCSNVAQIISGCFDVQLAMWKPTMPSVTGVVLPGSVACIV